MSSFVLNAWMLQKNKCYMSKQMHDILNLFKSEQLFMMFNIMKS